MAAVIWQMDFSKLHEKKFDEVICKGEKELYRYLQ